MSGMVATQLTSRADEGKHLVPVGSPHLLLCWPVRCRNAFSVALRSSLIFSCTEKVLASG